MPRKPFVDNLPLIHQGKVRDTFATGVPNTQLMVATDAVSTHNVPHLSLIPRKGQVLTALSVFFATEVFPDIPTHIVAYGRKIYEYLPPGRYPEDLHLRSLVVRKLTMAPVEFIFRARMAGSLWASYQKGESNPYGIDLPSGLRLMSPFESVLFTPTEKSATDDPVNTAAISALYPTVAALARDVYWRGREYALVCGIDVLDFKCEIGADGAGKLHLADEWLNGDCCRFVRTDKIIIGEDPPWADKEIFRQEAVHQWGGKKCGPPLEFPDHIIRSGMEAYRNVFLVMTGRTIEEYQVKYFA